MAFSLLVMTEQFVKESRMSSLTQGSQQPQTTKSGRRKAGRRLGSVPANKLPSRLPDLVGQVFNHLKICSDVVQGRGKRGRPYMLTRCEECGREEWKSHDNLLRLVAGCRKCGRRKNVSKPVLDVPRWLWQRCEAAKMRCEHPKDPMYFNYGGRGIRFNFKSASAMGRWLMDNVGVDRSLQIDRIDNDGHYEKGNLRFVSAKINTNNQRTSNGTRKMHVFRIRNPEIRYADSTLAALLAKGLTEQEVIERYHRKSIKPKGVYGTYSTPDPEIASLCKDFSFLTA